MSAPPLTCSYCRKAPATQVFVCDDPHPKMPRAVDLVCGPCGDFTEKIARGALVYRYQLTPLQEGHPT